MELGNLIYEVNISVDANIAKDYYEWLKAHIVEVVEKGKFKGAQIYAEKTQKCHWCVHYYCDSQEQLDGYLMQWAPILRKEASEKFGKSFMISRRILQPESNNT